MRRITALALVMSWVYSAGQAQAQTQEAEGVGVNVAVDVDEVPQGRIGLRLAARGNSTLGLGYHVAAVAGYHPKKSTFGRVSIGVEWAAAWSQFETDEQSITGTLRFLELEFGARIRLQPNRKHRRFVVLGLGGTLMRVNVPIAPDSKREYVGPYLSVGYEPKVDRVSLSFDVRVGLIATGPSALTFGVTGTLSK